MTLRSERILVAPGQSTRIPIELNNTSSEDKHFFLSVQGVPANWVTFSEIEVRIPAGGRSYVWLAIRPERAPDGKPGLCKFAVQASNQQIPDQVLEVQGSLLVGIYTANEHISLLTGANHLPVTPGQSVDVPLYLMNLDLNSHEYRLSVSDLEPDWYTISSNSFDLKPGQRLRIDLSIHPRNDWRSRAGRHPFQITVSPKNGESNSLTLAFSLTVTAFTEFNAHLQPMQVHEGSPVQVKVKNEGNIPQLFRLIIENKGTFVENAAEGGSQLRILPGESGEVSLKPKISQRRWLGGESVHPYDIIVKPVEGEIKRLRGEVLSEARVSLRFPDTLASIFHIVRRWNWPLILGSLIVSAFIILAILGPNIAPQDPMQENYALRIEGRIVRPPYPTFTLPGYPLGTDRFGRDLFSRILWGVRPTMTLVLTVAFVRLFLGYVLGLMTGWSRGFIGKFLEGLLSISLSIPVLIVALMGITAIGIRKGLVAFIFGLALTGWAETARFISTQTRIIKNQSYIEAARSLGASDFGLLANHIVRQVAPLLGMLFAFEISSTLFVVAELGFLGYFIGGGAWIEVSDFELVNAISLPELGQMLSNALVTLVKPAVLVVVGSVIFLAILGFNLLGEGLRLRLSKPEAAGHKWYSFIGGNLRSRLEKRYPRSWTDWVEANGLVVGIAGAVLLVVGGWSTWWLSKPTQVSSLEQVQVVVPGGHYWATERQDAQGSRWTPFQGPVSSTVLWEYQVVGSERPLSSGPAVDADGTVYLPTMNRELIALSSSGVELWRAELPSEPVGAPALGASGEIYITDQEGNLTVISPEGEILWRYESESGREATSGPLVSSDGMVYYTRVDNIQAVSPGGEPAWRSIASDVYEEKPPLLSAGESYIFLSDSALSAANGLPLNLTGIPVDELLFTSPAFFVGADQQTYFRSGHTVYAWRLTETGLELDPARTWSYEGNVVLTPMDQGVTPEGFLWLFYSDQYSDTRIVWIDLDGKKMSEVRLPDRQSKMIGVDKNLTSYLCSNNFTYGVNCVAYEIGESDPLWVLNLGDEINVVGGALAPGRMYISMDSGRLVAIGAKNP